MNNLGLGGFQCLFHIFNRKSIVFYCIIIYILGSCIALHSCCSNKEMYFEVEIVNCVSEDIKTPALVFRAINHSDRDYYILSFNPFTCISIFDMKGENISEYFWTIYTNTMPIPEPPMKNHVAPITELDDFIYKATQIDLSRTKSRLNDSIPTEHRSEIVEILSSKYQLVTLIKAGEIYEKYFPIKFMEIDAINTVCLSYNYRQIIENVSGYTTIVIDSNQYLLPNLPTDRVEHYHLFKGAMKNKSVLNCR